MEKENKTFFQKLFLSKYYPFLRRSGHSTGCS